MLLLWKNITRFSLLGLLLLPNQVYPQNSKLSLQQSQQFRKWMHALTINLFFSKDMRRPVRNAISNPIINKRWGEKNRDCAGFIRYLVWESLNFHSSNWHQSFGSAFTIKLQDIKHKVKYPYFQNRKGMRSNYVNAKDLMVHNTHFISRNKKSLNLKEGDILFYKVSASVFHSMLLFRNYQLGNWMVVYHTGSPKNQLRILNLEDLFQHANTSWHPSSMNPSFLGFFRLNLLP